jgi:acetoin utilization deacetylase AcuC-like enzyme
VTIEGPCPPDGVQVQLLQTMTTTLFTHPACLAHDPGPGHPERPARLTAVLDKLRQPAFAGLAWEEAPEASIAQLARVHPRDFVTALLAACPGPGDGRRSIDADTHVSAGSREAALRAAGAVCAAVDRVAAGATANAFCAVRPPGHHAEPDRPMGFCLFNNVAIGAMHARHAHGAGRVAVIDFDVHHGNGTEAAAYGDPDWFFASTHQMPLYPGTGARVTGGLGNILNWPLAPGAGSADFRHAFTEAILPALADFAPDFILVSAGFDAHADDPLAHVELTDDDYGWVTRELLRVARQVCGGRLVSTLEGGYGLAALARATAAHVAALAGLDR